jgi:GTP-binding protein
VEALKKAARKKPLVISAVSGEGVREALFALVREIKRTPADEEGDAESEKKPWSP